MDLAVMQPFLTAKTLEYTIIFELFFSKDGFAATQLEITTITILSQSAINISKEVLTIARSFRCQFRFPSEYMIFRWQ